jgi:predicted  nucleic acid-binding Zn-ribbon protein
VIRAVEDKSDSEIGRLAALQEMDRRLKEKRLQLGGLTGEIDFLIEQANKQRTELEAMRAERSVLETQRTELETRLGTEEARIKDSRMRLNRVRNDRELMALRREIEVAKESNKLIEDQLIAVMEQLEGLQARATAVEQTLAELQQRSDDEINGRREQITALTVEIDAIGSERAVAAQALAGPLRSKYEQIFERRGGTAVVEARNGICQGCRMRVPPQLYNELQKHHEIRMCPNCHRIIFWRAESASSQP